MKCPRCGSDEAEPLGLLVGSGLRAVLRRKLCGEVWEGRRERNKSRQRIFRGKRARFIRHSTGAFKPLADGQVFVALGHRALTKLLKPEASEG